VRISESSAVCFFCAAASSGSEGVGAEKSGRRRGVRSGLGGGSLVGVARGRLAEDDVLPASGVGWEFSEDEAGADLVEDGVEDGVGSANFGGAGVLPGGRFRSGERKGFFKVEVAERRRRLGGGRGVLGGGSAMVLLFESG
jgi:hypothetical protein